MQNGADTVSNAAVDLTDVPVVTPQDLGEAVRVLAAAGIPLIASRTISEDRFRAVEQAFWQNFDGPRELKTAILLRIRALSEVLGARRLNKFVSNHNSGMLRMTLKIAAHMRLNTKWGFNPTKFMMALSSALSSYEQPAGSPATDVRIAA
jgi:hypothetical protein